MKLFTSKGSMVNKTTVTAFVLGIIVAVFLLHAYTVYQVRQVAFQNQAVLNQVVSVLQQAGAAQSQAIQQQTAISDEQS